MRSDDSVVYFKVDLMYILLYADDILKIVSEYDQEIPQSQTTDNPVAPRDTRKTN